MTNRRLMLRTLISITLCLLLIIIAVPIAAQSTAFTYQGKLTDSGNLANGSFDFQFTLYDTATVGTGTQQGSPVTVSNVTVTNGIFTVQLDFGVCASCFNGAARFLEIAVRLSGGGSFTTLSPRQPVTSTPYAINSAQLGGLAASGFLQNSTSQQASSNFNISGNGTAGGTLTGSIVNATTQYNLNGLRAFTVNGAYNDGIGTVFTASNTFTGDGAGVNTTPSSTLSDLTGKFNSFYGAGAGQANTFGANNAFFGIRAGLANTGGFANAFFGWQAGLSNITGFHNAFFGFEAGFSNTTGGSNTFIGYQADFNVTNPTGNNNTLLGFGTRVTSGVSNGTAIGANAAVTQSNTLILGGISGVNNGTSVNVGIGTTAPQDRLHVAGDIRVGTSGTNGCVKNNNGGTIVGTCSSDARFKRDIVPFANLLSKVVQLRPVYFYWRSDEFPNRHFGQAQEAGLIAQEVEKVLPELVSTDEQGYKAVNYSKLPLITLQAIKELKAENDQLKQENAVIKQQLQALKQVVCKSSPDADLCKP